MALLDLYRKVNELSLQEAFDLLVAEGQADRGDNPADAVEYFIQMFIDEGGI